MQLSCRSSILCHNLAAHTSHQCVCTSHFHQCVVTRLLYIPPEHCTICPFLISTYTRTLVVITLTLPSSTTKLLVMLLKDTHLKDTLLVMFLKDIHLEYNELQNLPYSVNIMRILSFPIDHEHMMLLSNERYIKKLSSSVTL